MAQFLLQVAYTPDAVAGMVKHPEDRAAAARAAVEKLGGKMEGFWFAFGDYDVVAIIDVPDNVSAAACAMVVGQTGQFKAYKTTPLLTMEQAMQAMKKAGAVTFKAPGKP